MILSRRLMLAFGGAALAAGPVLGSPERDPAGMAPGLMTRALDALRRHADSISRRDTIGVADFSLPSRAPRFHILNLADGSVTSHLVAHGIGSDPAHTGWLQSFSNLPESKATSAGAYLTDEIYVGGHGPSIRLSGLDATNSNALARAIVAHQAWYVSEEVARSHGLIGRSDGCFAFAQASIGEVLARLGPGRMIYAEKHG